MEIREVTYLAVALRVVIAMILGGLIGLERGMKNRAAGMRTYMTVCLGACLVMLTNQFIYQNYGTGDPVRMGAQVVSGIGHSQIKGLTTAAGLWASAGIGLALGIGFYEAAIVGALGIFFVMTVLQGLDNRVHSKTNALTVYIELEKDMPLGDFLRSVQEKGLDTKDIQREAGGENGTRGYLLTVKSPKRRHHLELADEIRELPGVAFLEDL